jgi:hypothetical protein
MTQTVVIENNQTVVVETQQNTTVVLDPQQSRTIVTGIMGPRGASSFDQLSDIDLTQLGSGSLLIYNTGTSKWTATKLLDQQIVESGQY